MRRLLMRKNRAAVIGYLIMAAFVVSAFYHSWRIDEKLADNTALICKIANDNRDSLRQTLLDAAERTATSRQRTQQEKAEAAQFYAAALARIPAYPCAPKKIETTVP